MKTEMKLLECLKRYSTPTQPLENMFQEVERRSEGSKDVVIPILGMQGMGKSTLINGLLKANILPNDADETTCVPVEIIYGEKEYGEVIFKNQQPVVKVFSREDLNLYVDNNENPANKKQVERIKLFRKAEILKNGLVLVDLPGVGSITAENERTTKRYIENVSTAVFVIPTVPTIRRMEEIFIQGAWSQFSNAMFVQNDFGETKEEIKDSIDHNTKILNQIAGRIGSKLNGSILVINAYNAVKGAIDKNQKLIDSSGIGLLERRIHEVSSNWASNKVYEFKERKRNIVGLAIKSARLALDKSLKSETERAEQNKKEYETFRSQAEGIIAKANDTKAWLATEKKSVHLKISKLVSTTKGNIRAGIYQIIDNGNVDGQRLSDAFAGIQSNEIQSFYTNATEELREFAIHFQSQMIELEGMLEAQAISGESHETLNIKDKTKYEKSFEVIGAIGGSILGTMYAGTVAALIVSNPAGWVVGAVGLAIAGIATLIGSFFKAEKQAKRKAEAKDAVNPKISAIEKKLASEMQEQIDKTFNDANNLISTIIEKQEDEVRQKRRETRRPDTSTKSEDIKKDIEYLESIIKTI